MRSFGLCLVAVLLTVASPAVAQQTAGDSELQFQGLLSLGLKSDAPNNGAVFLNYGRFFTDRQEAGFSLFVFAFEEVNVESNSETNFTGLGGLFYRYNFSTSKTVPYLGIAASRGFGELLSGDILLTFEGGTRWFLKRNVAFSLAATFGYDVHASDFSDQLQFLFGFSYIWGK